MGSIWPWSGRGAHASRVRRALRCDEIGAVIVVGRPAAGKTRLARELTVTSPSIWVAGCRAGHQVSLGAFARWVVPATQQVPAPTTAVAESVLNGTRLLVVDDAHLLDDDSLAVVAQVVADPNCRCLLTLTSGTPWPSYLTDLTERADVEVIELADLSREETAELLGARLGGPIDSGTVGQFFQLTHGTPGYLVSVGDQAIATGSLRQRFGVWSVRGDLEIPAHLPDILRAQLATAGPDTSAVVDYLTETSCLPVDRLIRLTSPEALAAAVAHGLVRSRGDHAELAHPMIAAVRRVSPGLAVRRRLRDVLTQELSRSDISARNLDVELALASLAFDHPGFPDRDFVLARGADAAVRALDYPRALRYCCAVSPGPFRIAALLTEGYLHSLRSESVEAETKLCQVQAACDNGAVTEVATLLRVYNQVVAGDLGCAEVIIGDAGDGLHSTSRSAVTGFLSAARGFAPQARDLLTPIADRAEMTELARMYVTMGTVIAAGDLGRPDEISKAVARGDAQADRWRMAAYQRVTLCCFEIHARQLIGDVAGAQRAAQQIDRLVPALAGPGQYWLAAIAAAATSAAADCRSAAALLQSALAGLDAHDSPEFIWFPFVVD
ncbi:MAG: hypothetical protein WAW85_06270, partial [Gordonia sp. (in: high G+C Gram-positive bacteria)]|uniref:hypothetical protein n=1 Tax=Gordonia sp. (in: high G+C Gram-positive bacteria) TaxID=84139 RepID=UPI003BB4F258